MPITILTRGQALSDIISFCVKEWMDSCPKEAKDYFSLIQQINQGARDGTLMSDGGTTMLEGMIPARVLSNIRLNVHVHGLLKEGEPNFFEGSKRKRALDWAFFLKVASNFAIRSGRTKVFVGGL